MPRNVEIKARIASKIAFSEVQKTASALSDCTSEILIQEDVFYKCSNGRLKARTFDHGAMEVIWYKREDTAGPKCSTYQIYNASAASAKGLKQLLAAALGEICTVRKKRVLYIIGQTRVHLDDVENLGIFAELETVLRDDQTIEDGTRIAQEIAAKLHLTDFVQGAYADLLINKKEEEGKK